MAGNVYVLNITGENLELSLNGAPAGGAISGWSSAPADRYRPNVAAVPRTLNASDGPGKFCNGNNQLMLSRVDGMYSASVRIDGNSMPLNQDLLLLVERNSWQLVSAYGVAVANGEVSSLGMLGAADGEPHEEG